jgi:hypothetical protein
MPRANSPRLFSWASPACLRPSGRAQEGQLAARERGLFFGGSSSAGLRIEPRRGNEARQ